MQFGSFIMRVYLTVVLLLAANFPAIAEVVKPENMDEAIEKVPCEHFKKNANGTWSLTEVAMGTNKNASLESLIIADPQQVEALEKRCSKL
jgi:hypothetical protein